jgi:hypothetical protein
MQKRGPARLGGIDRTLGALQSALARISGGRVRLVKYVLTAQPVVAQSQSRGGGSLAVTEVHAGDPRIALFPRPREEIERRFAGGARCFAAWHADAFAGFLWFAEHGYDEHEVCCTFRLHPDDRAVWDFDVYVDPGFRATRAFALLWSSALAAMHARGVRWSISQVNAFNVESKRAHARLGARQIGWALFVLSGRLQWTLTSRGQVTCRRLEHGPYPVIDVRPPSDGAGRASVDTFDPSRAS